MSVKVFFNFSLGLEQPLVAPKGTLASIIAHVEEVEEALGLKRMEVGTDDPHLAWDHWDERWRKGFPDVDDKVLCETIGNHNDWVRSLYNKFGGWFNSPVENGEIITPDDAKQFWHGLQTLTVRPDRWSADYYRARMEHCFEVLRGRENEGVSFDAKALTPAQAGAVIHLFETFLDPEDARLECPKDRDYLADSDEYDWCAKCGAVMPDDVDNCRKRKCPVLAERNAA